MVPAKSLFSTTIQVGSKSKGQSWNTSCSSKADSHETRSGAGAGGTPSNEAVKASACPTVADWFVGSVRGDAALEAARDDAPDCAASMRAIWDWKRLMTLAE